MTTTRDPAQIFTGRWRILEMDRWSKAYLDLVEEAHLTFRGAQDGYMAYGTIEGSLDVIYVAARAVFSWKGQDGADDVCGSGWATLGTDGRLVGHLHLEDGHVCAFVCERGLTPEGPASMPRGGSDTDCSKPEAVAHAREISASESTWEYYPGIT